MEARDSHEANRETAPPLIERGSQEMRLTPLVSIITPAYNRAGFLRETIDSVLSQDYPRIEHIVLDDGSTDETPEVLLEYEGQITTVRHPNMGEARTVNRGIEISHGEIIVVVNSDDPLLPGAVSTAVAFLAEHPGILVAYPDWEEIDHGSNAVRHVAVPEHDYARMVRDHKCYIGPGAFIRRRGFDSAGVRNPKYQYTGDFEFWVRLGLYGPFARMPEALATWRTHPGSVSSTAQGKAMAREHVAMMKEYFSRSDVPGEIRALRRQAMASAHFKAARSSGTSRLTLLWQLVCSAALDPKAAFTKRFRYTLLLLLRLLPGPVAAGIRAVWHFIHR